MDPFTNTNRTFALDLFVGLDLGCTNQTFSMLTYHLNSFVLVVYICFYYVCLYVYMHILLACCVPCVHNIHT